MQLTSHCSQVLHHHLEDIASTHDTWDPHVPLVMLIADTVQLSCPPKQVLQPHLVAPTSIHDTSVKLVADTTTLAAGIHPLVMLTADTAPLPAGLEPSLTPTSMPPCKPMPELRPPLLIHEGPVAHMDVYMDDFIGLAQGSQELC